MGSESIDRYFSNSSQKIASSQYNLCNLSNEYETFKNYKVITRYKFKHPKAYVTARNLSRNGNKWEGLCMKK